jgi:hypothetical protein
VLSNFIKATIEAKVVKQATIPDYLGRGNEHTQRQCTLMKICILGQRYLGLKMETWQELPSPPPALVLIGL